MINKIPSALTPTQPAGLSISSVSLGRTGRQVVKLDGNCWIEKRPVTGICIMASAWDRGDIRYIVMGRMSGDSLYLFNRFTREEVPINIGNLQSGYAKLMAL